MISSPMISSSNNSQLKNEIVDHPNLAPENSQKGIFESLTAPARRYAAIALAGTVGILGSKQEVNAVHQPSYGPSDATYLSYSAWPLAMHVEAVGSGGQVVGRATSIAIQKDLFFFTASWALEMQQQGASAFKISSGLDLVNDRGDSVTSANLVIHPDFNPANPGHTPDLAKLKLPRLLDTPFSIGGVNAYDTLPPNIQALMTGAGEKTRTGVAGAVDDGQLRAYIGIVSPSLSLQPVFSDSLYFRLDMPSQSVGSLLPGYATSKDIGGPVLNLNGGPGGMIVKGVGSGNIGYSVALKPHILQQFEQYSAPEPSTAAMLGLGAVAMYAGRRRFS